MNKKLTAILFAGCLGLALAAGPTAASAADGQVNAVSTKPLPAAPAFAVRALDDSDVALSVKQRLVEALKAKGYRLDPKAPLILTFEIIDQPGAFTDTDQRYFFDLGARGGRTGGEDAHARFNVYDSQTGGILNKGHGGKTTIVTPTKYQLDVTIDGPAPVAGHVDRYWRGWVVGNLGAADVESLVDSMVQPLVDSIGQTVRAKPYPLAE